MMEPLSGKIRVLLAEDHTIVRQGLRALLERCAEIVIAGEASDGHEAVRMVSEVHPHVVLMDLGMPGLNGVDATRKIRSEHPSISVVVLSMHSGPEHVRPAVRAGASGYLVKGIGLSDLVVAIQTVAAGGAFFSPAAAEVLLGSDTAQDPDRPELTDRELEILELVATGWSSASIAENLDVSIKTVERHRSRIMTKLDVSNAAALVREAIRRGFIEVDA